MLGRVALLYYEYNLTHQEIADLLGVSRIKVTRALAEARRQGIVRIEVHTDATLFVEEEHALIDRYHLDHAWVAPSDSKDPFGPIAKLAADCLVNLVTSDMHVAVGLSSLLAITASLVDPKTQVKAEFVPLQGTVPGRSAKATPANIALQLARKFGGTAHDIAVPLVPKTAETAAMIRSEPEVASVFELARNCELALVGVGGSKPGSSYILGTLSDEHVALLIENGAVGDINAHFFDARGQAVESPISDLLLALDLDAFSEIPLRVGIAGGDDKVEALRAALTGGLLNGVVTDVNTARKLI